VNHDYEFRVKGRIGPELLETFAPLQIEPDMTQTVLVGPIVDGADLYGVLARLETHGLELLELRRLPTQSARS
jgi:hypothetical protein